MITTLCSLLITVALFTYSETPEELLGQYQTLCTSLENQRGLADGDIEVVRGLRDKMSDWTSTHDDFQVIVAELQMSIWLDDVERSNSLFQKLSQIQPKNTAIALAWAEYLLSQEGNEPAVVYGELIERFPDSPEIVLAYVRTLDAKNQFTDAVNTLEKLNSESLGKPKLAEMYASLLYADNRFDESVAALDAIDRAILASDPPLSTRIDSAKKRSEDAATKWQEELSIREVEEIASDLPLLAIQTSKGLVEVELFEDHAPNTVANFISLADSGYYDGILFHRVIPKFMAQGGDPNTKEDVSGNPGEGGPGYTIKDEHTIDGHRNHFAGSLSMAKTSAPNTGGSQFFLTHLPTPHLDGRHTVFGRITSGLDVARSIEKNDHIISVIVLRKRDHEYTPEKIGDITVNVPPQDKSKESQKDKPLLTPSLNPK